MSVFSTQKSLSILTACVMLASCAGRDANPVQPVQFGDDKKSCDNIQQEMFYIEGEVRRLTPESEKGGKNAALGVTGFFLLVPLFFMDFSEAERVEINAYRLRYNNLIGLAMDKNCGFDAKPIPALESTQPKSEPSPYPTRRR